MASTYTGLGTELMTTGENASTWGTKTNTNLNIIEQLAGGYIEKSIAGTVIVLLPANAPVKAITAFLIESPVEPSVKDKVWSELADTAT